MTLSEILKLLKKHLKLIIILPLLFGMGAAFFCWGFLENEYTSKIDIYVLARNEQNPSNPYGLQNDVAASQQLSNDVAVLVKSSRVANAVKDDLHIDSLEGYKIDVTSTEKNRVISLSVTGTNPAGCSRIVDSLAKQTARLAVDVMNVEAVNIIDQPSVPTVPSGPPRTLYTIAAIGAGLLLALFIIFIIDVLDTTIKQKDDMEEKFGVPVLSQMPFQKDLKN